jgi:hypothetical protein
MGLDFPKKETTVVFIGAIFPREYEYYILIASQMWKYTTFELIQPRGVHWEGTRNNKC